MDIVVTLIILLYSAILHEIAHGYVAYRLGDPTAKILGRLTLNPIKHIDPFLSIIFPLLLLISNLPILGGAKPIPVDPFNLRDGRKDMALVSLAGPVTNILLAILASILLHIFYSRVSLHEAQISVWLRFVLGRILVVNLSLAIFNLVPIPPLDGSKVFAMILPKKDAAAYLSLGSIGIFIIYLLLSFPIGPFSLSGLINNLLNFSLSLLGF